MSRKYLPNLTRIKKALTDNGGYVAFTAKKLGIHYTTLYRIINENPELKDFIVSAREEELDFTENKLMNAIRNDQGWAIQFKLRTQGKKRGYSERIELTGDEGSPINAVTFNLSDIPFSDETKSLSVAILRSMQKDIGTNDKSE